MTLLFGRHHEELVTGYRRTLDLDDGIAAVEYALHGTSFRREIFASAPDDVVVLRLTADQPGSIEVGSHYYRRYDAFERLEGTDHVSVAASPSAARGSTRAPACSPRAAGPSRSEITSLFVAPTRSRSSSARRRLPQRRP